MIKIPLTVLVHDAPCARAYLTVMRHSGLRPRKIILTVDSRKPGTQRPLMRWLPRSLRAQIAERLHEQANNHWPRRILRDHPQLVGTIAETLHPWVPNAAQMYQEITQWFRYEDYAHDVQRILVAGFKDERLKQVLQSEPEGTPVLFTGEGILPASLVELDTVRFLHVHPGFLPQVRGADGFLWSALVERKLGASCFYMDRGIDTGRIIAAKKYPLWTFPIPPEVRPDDSTLYRALFSFIDPFLRADLLIREVLMTGLDLFSLPSCPQKETDGMTFHFMQPPLRREALNRVFREAA